MPNYRDLQNKIHFLDDDSYEYMLPAGCIKISAAEAALICADATPILVDLQSELCNRIDFVTDAARLKIAGNSLRVVEYQRAETEAKEYSAAEYTGTVPLSIASWAEAKGWTAQEATDDILRAASVWNAALYAFRDIRLKGKETVKAAADSIAAQTAADAVFAQIEAILVQVH